MLDFEQQISLALAGDASALGALYSETVATVYYSSLRITGAAYPAHLVTVRTYRLAFANLSRLNHPQAFPVWLDRLSVYLAYHASADRYSGAELSAAREDLIAFLRDFHRMSDAEIAALLAVEEQAVTNCDAQAQGAQTDEFLMGKDAVLGIWHDICDSEGTNGPAGDVPLPAPSAPVRGEDGAQTPASAARKDLRESAEYKMKRTRRRVLRICAAAALLLLIGGTVYGALHARNPEERRTEREVSRLANKLSVQLSGQVGEIYPISEDKYFVSINLGYGGVEGLVVQYELAENAIRVSSPDGGALSESELQKLTGDRYMQVLYNPTGTGSGAARAGALDAKPGDVLPSAQPTESPAPTKTPIVSEKYEGSEYDPLENRGDFSILLRINCRNVDLSRPMTIVMDSAISKAIGDAGGLQIALNDARHCITLSTAQLQKLCSAYGSVTVRLHAQSDRRYSIAFYSETGQKVTELFSTMTFTLPADGPMTYVFAVYDSGTESRGGIYDKENETISFPVYLSGVYELIGSEREIRDSDAMDDETAKAAYFLSALEFMPPDSAGRFRPNDTMTRNEAVSIIGRMFLATDQSLTSAYPDVDFSDPAYAYITFGTATHILTGVGDGTFRGESEISREDLITICGRTLLYRFRKEASERTDAPLGFDDESLLSDYARDSAALLIENGILKAGGALRPKDAATRGEAAVLLYRMYCCLYGYEAD